MDFTNLLSGKLIVKLKFVAWQTDLGKYQVNIKCF